MEKDNFSSKKDRGLSMRRNPKNPKVSDGTIIVEENPEPSQAILTWKNNLEAEKGTLLDFLKNNTHLSLVEQVPTKQRIRELDDQLRRLTIRTGGPKMGRRVPKTSEY